MESTRPTTVILSLPALSLSNGSKGQPGTVTAD